MALLNPLGLKSLQLISNNGEIQVTSPQRLTFQWPAKIGYADCPTCPKDKDGYVEIQRGCSCGIYTSIDPDVVLRGYCDSNHHVVFMVEALGSGPKGNDYVWLHWPPGGFTAPGIMVAAVVKPKINGQDSNAQARMAAAVQYNVPIINMNVAMIAIKTNWLFFTDWWPEELDAYL